MRALAAVLAALIIAFAPAAAAEPSMPVPPEGTLIVGIGVSDGTNLLPVGSAVVLGVTCLPG